MNAYRCTLGTGIDTGAYTVKVGDVPYSYLQSNFEDTSIWKGTDGININSIYGNVVIGNNVRSANFLFFYTNFRSSVIVGRNVTGIKYMFGSVNNYSANVYILGNTYRFIHTLGMFNNCGRERKNVYFNSVLNDSFNNQFIVYQGVTWEDMLDGNGFYNSYYQIYCYNNFSGEV